MGYETLIIGYRHDDPMRLHADTVSRVQAAGRCGTCGAANSAGSAYCSTCGANQHACVTCGACGAAQKDSAARFCNSCGKALTT